MLGSELLPLIKASGKADRLSENLMKWVRKYKTRPMFVAIATECKYHFDAEKTQAGLLYVGWGHEGHGLDDGYLMGSRLSDILCNGVRAFTAAFVPGMKFVEVPFWWEHYIQFGKCAIDPEHWLYADHERWEVSEDGQTRRCLWCGNYEQHLHTEMVSKTEWRRVPQA